MTTTLIAVAFLLFMAALVRYARHDHFAGPASLAESHDELGSLTTRDHLVPRR